MAIISARINIAGRVVQVSLEDKGRIISYDAKGASVEVLRSEIRIDGKAVAFSDVSAAIVGAMPADNARTCRCQEDDAVLEGVFHQLGASDDEIIAGLAAI